MYNHYTSENQRHTHIFNTHIKNTTYSHLWHPHQQHTHILDTHITNILTFLTLKSQKPTKNNYITNNNKQHIIKHSLKLVHCFTNHNKSLSSLKCANMILAKNTLIPIVNVCVCTSSFSCSILYETDSLVRPFSGLGITRTRIGACVILPFQTLDLESFWAFQPVRHSADANMMKRSTSGGLTNQYWKRI